MQKGISKIDESHNKGIFSREKTEGVKKLPGLASMSSSQGSLFPAVTFLANLEMTGCFSGVCMFLFLGFFFV